MTLYLVPKKKKSLTTWKIQVKYESSIQMLWSKLKFLQTDRVTDKLTGQNLHAPYLSMWGHKTHPSGGIKIVIKKALQQHQKFLQFQQRTSQSQSFQP